MFSRIFAIVLIVLGLATAGAGIASGTVWRPSETVTATLPQAPQTPVVLAGGNVLATVNPKVKVTIEAADSETPVTLAMGRSVDVRAWVGEAKALEITGLDDWDTLAVQEAAAPESSAEPSEQPSQEASQKPKENATVPDPRGSDLWIEELSDNGTLTYEWTQVEGDFLMLVASDGKQPAPEVSLTWEREVTTPLMVPGIVVGTVLFLIGAVWLTLQLLMAREEKRARARATAPDTGEVAVVPTVSPDGTPLTRRQLREAERAQQGRRRSNDDATVLPSVQPQVEAAEGQDAGEPASDSADPDGADQTPGEVTEVTHRRRWRRRNSAPVEPEEPVESAPRLGNFTAWGAPRIGHTGEAAPVPQADQHTRSFDTAVPVEPDPPVDGTEDYIPQTSGASWRQTWGLGTPAPADESPDDERDDR